MRPLLTVAVGIGMVFLAAIFLTGEAAYPPTEVLPPVHFAPRPDAIDQEAEIRFLLDRQAGEAIRAAIDSILVGEL